MNILLLSNSAPNYHYFFNRLAQNFQKDGANVVVAVDSEFSRDTNNLNSLGFTVYEFSAYFASHQTNSDLLEKYDNFNLNSALLSDFERAEVYDIWGFKEFDYFDRLKSALLSYFEEIFQRHEISTVLYENVSNTFSHFALFVAQKFSVNYCGIGGSRLPGRFSITADPLNDKEPAKIFQAIRCGDRLVMPDVTAWCEEYLSNIETTTPDYMKINGLDNTSLLKRYMSLNRMKTVIMLLRHLSDDAYHSFQMGNPFLHYFNLFKRNVLRKIKISWLAGYYETPNNIENYLLYPLHFHPESSTSILAGTYLNEYEVIRNIAFNLPQGIILYVKDHVSAYGFQSINFYKKLKKIPNVRIINPNEKTKLLIKKSIGVITLTSTVGYEALLMGKKVFLYGSVFYDFHKNVIKITNPAELFTILKSNLEEKICIDKKYNIDFISSCYLATESGTLNLMLKSNEGIKMADEIYPKVLNYLKSTS